MRYNNNVQAKIILIMIAIALFLSMTLPAFFNKIFAEESSTITYTGSSLASYKDDGNMYDLVIDSSVSSVPASEFNGWSNIQNIVINDASTALTLGNNCFSNIENLYGVRIGRSLSFASTNRDHAPWKGSGSRFDGIRFTYSSNLSADATFSRYIFYVTDMYCFVPEGFEYRDGYFVVSSSITSIYLNGKTYMRHLILDERSTPYSVQQYQFIDNYNVESITISNTRNYSQTNQNRLMYQAAANVELGCKLEIIPGTTRFASHLMAGVEVSEVIYSGDDIIYLPGTFLDRYNWSTSTNCTWGNTEDKPITIKAKSYDLVQQSNYAVTLPADGSVVNLFGAYVRYQTYTETPEDVYPDNNPDVSLQDPWTVPNPVTVEPVGEYNSVADWLNALADNIETQRQAQINALSETSINYNVNGFNASVMSWMQEFNVSYFKGMSIFGEYVRLPYSLIIDESIEQIAILRTLYYCSCAIAALMIISRGVL